MYSVNGSTSAFQVESVGSNPSTRSKILSGKTRKDIANLLGISLWIVNSTIAGRRNKYVPDISVRLF